MCSRARAKIVMSNSSIHTITIPSSRMEPMKELKTLLKEATNFLFADGGEVIIVNQIHSIVLEEK